MWLGNPIWPLGEGHNAFQATIWPLLMIMALLWPFYGLFMALYTLQWVLPKKEEPEPLAGIELPDVPRRKRSKRDHDVKVEKS